MSERRGPIQHLESLIAILKDLAPQGIELYEHRYHPQAFGSFELVLGRGHEHFKFMWDSRDSILSMSFAAVTNKNANPSWTHDADLSLANGEGVFAQIAFSAAKRGR